MSAAVAIRRLVVVLQGLAGAVALARLARGRNRRAPLGPGAPAPDGAISVVVPARDEAERLGPCLEGLQADPDLGELIVVVDPDDEGPTAEVAARLGAQVLVAPPLPDGWVGKPWALHRGVEAATGRWLVTFDADTRPRPGLLRALVAELAAADLVTAGTRFTCDTAGERFLHPAMLATLVYRFGPVGAEDDGGRPERVVGNGQCLAMERERFRAAGGFARERGFMTDEIALLRSLAASGWRIRFLDGADLISVDMHTSGGEVWREWGRSLSMGDVTSRPWQALDLLVLWLAMAAPIPRLLARRGTALDVALAAVRFALLAALARVYERRGLAFWLSPLADPAAAARLTIATLRPSRTWRGRSYAPTGERRGAVGPSREASAPGWRARLGARGSG